MDEKELKVQSSKINRVVKINTSNSLEREKDRTEKKGRKRKIIFNDQFSSK
jgi:hypothetical protein